MLRILTASAAIALIAAQDAQRSKIEIVNASGQKAAVTTESVMELSLVGEGTSETKSTDVKVIAKEKFMQEILADGKVKLFCESATLLQNAKEIASPASGKTFVIDAAGATRVVRSESGDDVKEAYVDHLARWLDLKYILPTAEVVQGDSWPVDLTPLLKSISFNYDLTALQVQCSLSELKEGMATISFKFDHDGKVKNRSLTLSMTGDVTIDVAKKRPTVVKLKGSFTQKEDLVEVGKNVDNRTSEQTKIGTGKVECRRFLSTVSFEYGN